MYFYYVYINTNTCMYIFKKLYYVYILHIFIYNIKYNNLNIYMQIFSKYILHVCVFIYSTHTYVM